MPDGVSKFEKNVTEDEAVNAAIREFTSVWFENFGVIGAKTGGAHIHRPVPNYLQLKIDETLSWLRENGMPVRMLVLKPRQRGCSTFTVADLYCEMQRGQKRGIIIGGTDEQSSTLFAKAKVYAQSDEFDWENDVAPDCNENRISWGNDDWEIVHLTGRNPEAGRGGSAQYLLVTEAARWPVNGAYSADSIIQGILACVAPVAGTTVIMETTAKGAVGMFYDRWVGRGKTGDVKNKTALDFEEFKARHARGEYLGDRWVRIFAPWFAFDDATKVLTNAQRRELAADLSEKELEIMNEHALSLEQMQWRRDTIISECKGDEDAFEQDFPSSWEKAFQMSGRQRFSSAALAHLKAETPKKGTIEVGEDAEGEHTFAWRDTEPEEPVAFHLWERPTPGYKYLAAVDVATGAEQQTGDDPDCHSVGIIRAAQREPSGDVLLAKLVARSVPGANWEQDYLATNIYRLCGYYGFPVCAIEVNNCGLATIELVRNERGMSLYRRTEYNKVECKETKQLGWKTSAATRPLIIANLAEHLHKRGKVEHEKRFGIDVPCEVAQAQLRDFVRSRKGKEEAASGSHDDDVMMLAIGLKCVDEGHATLLHEYQRARIVPPEFRHLVEMKGRARGAMAGMG
jgi:hypothetical protein